MLEKCLDNIRCSCPLGGEYIIIGNAVRKELAKRLFGATLAGQDKNEHLDILVRCDQGKKKEILDYLSTNYPRRGMAYVGRIKDTKIEFVGLVDGERQFYIDGNVAKPRPDATIERIGHSTLNLSYDEFGTGFDDFRDKKIVINPKSSYRDLWPTKVIKLFQLMLQLKFDLDEESRDKMQQYLDEFDLSILKNYDAPVYNRTPYHDVPFPFDDDPLKIGLVIRALYSRCDNPEEATALLRGFNQKFDEILNIGGIDFSVFEEYSRKSQKSVLETHA
jgi:hypothetical protein